MNHCDCDLQCNNTYHGHVCTLDFGHDGPHSCHGRVFRQAPRKGDIIWTDTPATGAWIARRDRP